MGRGAGVGPARARRPKRRGPRGPFKWHEDALERELRAFVGSRPGARFWPTRREFETAGQLALWQAMKSRGGSLYWARRLGLALSARQARAMLSETASQAEAKARISELGYLPGAKKLRALGHRQLAAAVERMGGSKRFRSGLGL